MTRAGDNTKSPDRFARALRSAVSVLEAGGWPYAVIGGTGVLVWGHPVMTKDIDFIIDASRTASEDLVRSFLAARYRVLPGKTRRQAATAFRNGWFVRLSHPNGLWADVMRATDESDKAIVAGAKTARLFGVVFSLAAPEDIIAHKLIRFSDKDKAGIKSVLVVSGRILRWRNLAGRAEALAKSYGEAILKRVEEVDKWRKLALAGKLPI